MTESLRLAWCMFTCHPRPRSLSDSWAISLLRCSILILRTPLFLSRYWQDKCLSCPTSAARFRHRYSLVLYLPLRHSCPLASQNSLSKSPIAIMAQAVQDREKWLVIQSDFHPQDSFDFHVNANFLDHNVNNILALFLGRSLGSHASQARYALPD